MTDEANRGDGPREPDVVHFCRCRDEAHGPGVWPMACGPRPIVVGEPYELRCDPAKLDEVTCPRCLAALSAEPVPPPVGLGPAPLEQKAAKRAYDLVPHEALGGMADALTYGAKKHGAWQWRQIPAEELRRIYYAALMRHVEAWRADPSARDAETGLYHLDHALACLAILRGAA